MARHAILLTVAFRGGTIHSRVIGPEGRPWLVFCHGMGLDSDNMLALAEALAPDWRILLWDMPGHGASSLPEDYRISLFVEALEVAIDAAGATQPVLLGFSFGGIVAQYALAARPAAYRGLAAYGCFAPFHQSPPVPRAMIGAALLPYRLRSWRRIKGEFARRCAASNVGQAEVARALDRCSKPVFVAMAKALLESFAPQPALRFGCPLLILRGANDSNGALLEDAASGLIAAHPATCETIIADAGHCAHNDRPAEVAAALSQFLDHL